MLELPLRQSPLLAALREICHTQIGPVQLLRCNVTAPPGKNSESDAEGFLDVGYLDFCLQFLGGEPAKLLASGLQTGSLFNLFIECANGSALQLNQCMAEKKRSCRLELFSAAGTAIAEFPNRLRWRNKEGIWTRKIPVKKNPLLEMLREFHQIVVQKEQPAANLQEGCRLWHWQRLILQSWKQGSWVESISP